MKNSIVNEQSDDKYEVVKSVIKVNNDKIDNIHEKKLNLIDLNNLEHPIYYKEKENKPIPQFESVEIHKSKNINNNIPLFIHKSERTKEEALQINDKIIQNPVDVVKNSMANDISQFVEQFENSKDKDERTTICI